MHQRRKFELVPFSKLYPHAAARDVADAAADAVDERTTTLEQACVTWLKAYEAVAFGGKPGYPK